MECGQCKEDAILDERTLGPSGLLCPGCKSPIDPRIGRWVPRNPNAAWGSGFWISHLMVPWLNYEEILDRQRVYDIARFTNEVLGLPVALGDHIVTRSELEACCSDKPMANTLADVPPAGRQMLIAGVDWGGGGVSTTSIVIGFMRSDYRFEICRFERFPASEDPNYVLHAVAQRCAEFKVRIIAADAGGSGHVYNRLLLDKLQRDGGCTPSFTRLSIKNHAGKER